MRTCEKCNQPDVVTTHGPAVCYGCQRRRNPKTSIRRRSHRRMVTPRGERHGRAKLTAAQVDIIRERLAAGDKKAAIARDFEVDPALIYQIDKGLIWQVAQLV